MVVAWSMARHVRTELIINALKMARPWRPGVGSGMGLALRSRLTLRNAVPPDY